MRPSEESRAPPEPSTEDLRAEDGRVARARGLREARREQVLEAARGVLAEKGFQAASVSDIIEAAGIARGTFYLYFEGKQAVFGEILDGLFAQLDGCVEGIRIGPGQPPVMEQLRANVSRIVGVLLADRDLSRILRRTGAGVDEEFDAKLEEFYGRITELLDRTLGIGMTHGFLRRHDTRLVAHCILGSAKELTAHLHSMPPEDLPPVEELVDELLRYHLEGLLQR
jgi:AcrR family transcriptional regulator